MRDYRDFDAQFRETADERNERLREKRHKRTIETLQALIYDMSGMLADEFDYLTDEGITDLRRRTANALGTKCPEWLERYRDPAITGGAK